MRTSNPLNAPLSAPLPSQALAAVFADQLYCFIVLTPFEVDER